MSRPYRYEEARELLTAALGDLAILSGDVVGPGDVTWQDVAGTCVVNLRILATRIEAARNGQASTYRGGPLVFPSPYEAIEDMKTP